MMRALLSSSASAALIVAAGLTLASEAGAVRIYLQDIPSRPEACLTCHSDAATGRLNVFGEDAFASLFLDATDTFRVDWSLIFNIDSDRDGQTNGQELGDPCGQWQSDGPLRSFDLSNPGHEDETSGSPEEGCTLDETEPRPYLQPSPRIYDPGMGGPRIETGNSANFGCPTGMSQASLPERLGYLSFLLGLLVWRRRARRAERRA